LATADSMPTKEKRRPVSQSDTGSVDASIPLGKYLASTEKKIRDGAIKSLANFLAQSNREPLSDEEMAKLWKGIFYCESK
jgi:ribosomal RNA-processing protein 1